MYERIITLNLCRHAHYTLGNTSDAVSAFERGLAIDPSNAALQTGLESAQAKAAQSSETSPTVPSPSGAAGGPNFADMLRNFGGGAGGAPGPGGMPDLASLMNNPMMSEMARNMMANGGLDRLLSNPSVANMMERMSSGGGMPSMQELMSDPTMRELAQNLTGNAGGRP
ncbi:hypothetical protein SISSUDRAFT_23681 [Sistotremastrum suecicum HHB10207 ss-3]|uniref:STI1 domain-containing protein n=1 Tax=Sistotremastrum suecicum HHB10207 ss-3 TaxID=1314776 RepID=A0A166J934_9AGAM|nr:hypothetical protein SISSUDRAFT_23681 [Sistotremastrum suecicum HHB10207 ss-3]